MRGTAAYVVVAAVVCCSAAWAAGYQVEETPLVALDDLLWPDKGSGYTGIGADGRHFAYIIAKGQGEAVVVDGREGPVYDAIEGPVFFVPGTAEVAYAARKGDVVVAVIGGREGPEYDEVGHLERTPDRRPTPGHPHEYMSFSRDGSHAAYKARKGDKWLAVVDGQEGLEYDEVTWGPLFTDTGHWKYTARKGDNWLAVIDGQETPEYGWINSVLFSPDGTRVVYEASHEPREAGKSFYVVDGKEWPLHRRTGCLALRDGRILSGYRSTGGGFAPGGRRFVYAAEKGEKWVVVDEGLEGPEYDGVYGLSISPDGQHVAYKAWRGADPAQAEHVVVVDGVEGPVYGAIGCLVFSPDGKRFAYDARSGVQWGVSQVVVVDGHEGPRYQGGGPPSFGPDSRHVIYTAAVGDKAVVVLDGEESREYDAAEIFCFLPDGSGLIYKARRGEREFVVHNGQEGPPYAYVGELKLGPDGQHFLYVANKNPGVVVVVDGKEGPLWEGLEEMPIFSADGKHMAYAGGRKGQCIVVFDGREEGGYPSVNLAEDRDGAPVVGPHGEHIYTVGVGPREPAPKFDDPAYDEWIKTRKPGRRRVVVNGQPGPPYDEIATPWLAFQEDGTLEYLAKRDGMLFRVRHTPMAPPAH